MNRLSREAIRTLRGSADHPEHLRTDISPGGNLEVEAQLLAGTHVAHLGRAIEFQGQVTDESGAPIPDARVRAGYAAMSDTRKTKTGPNGGFSIGGCKPEKMPLSADAPGFASTTIQVDLAANKGPFHLTLKPGKLLRIRVVDSNSNGIPKAYVFYDNLLHGAPDQVPRNQADFETRTDSEGRVEWTNAPDEVLHFSFRSGDTRRDDIEIKPDGEEHVLTLALPSAPLTLVGSVTDAETHSLLPSFRIIIGWPTTNYLTKEIGGQWSTLDRFWLKFDGGNFQHTFTEPPLHANPNPGFIFKFEADGYSPFITRSFAGNEGEVRLDVALQPSLQLNITVLLPDGNPAAKADVGIVTTSSRLNLIPGGISHENLQSAESLFSTDDAGKISLSFDGMAKSIVIAHPEGFWQMPVAALATNLTIQLQPWSRIEGTLLYEGQPASGREVLLQLHIGDDRESFSTDRSRKIQSDDRRRRTLRLPSTAARRK